MMKIKFKEAVGIKKDDIILFVHGFWHGAWAWEKYFMNFFAQNGYSNYALNFREHDKPGKKKKINSVSLADYLEDLKNAISSLEQEPILIGHSMGGFIIQKYLEEESCKKVVLLSPAPPTGAWLAALKFLPKPYTLPNLFILDLYGLVNNPHKVKIAFFSDSIDDEKLEEFSEMMSAESFKAFLQILFPKIKINYHTKIPMLVIAGENDKIFSVKDNKKTARKYSADFVIIPDIAHDLMLDTNHEKVEEEILSWLEK